MNVKEFALNLIQLPKNSPTMVADLKDKLHRFLMGMSDLVVSECLTIIIHHDIYISRIMVYTKKLRSHNSRKEYGGENIYKRWWELVQCMVDKGFSTKVPLVLQRSIQIGFPMPNLNEVIVVPYMSRPNCEKAWRKHNGKCLVETEGALIMESVSRR